MNIYFVRHGKTEWNVEGRFQGYSGDSALVPEAYQDLEKLAQHLSAIPFDKIYSSDLQRARTTAEYIAQKNHFCSEVESNIHLREWNFGRLEGMKIDVFRSIYPHQYRALKENVAVFQADMFDGETVQQATTRFTDTLKRIIDPSFENILIVSHGAILTASIGTLLGYPTGQLRKRGGLNNASITILETNDLVTFKEISWNDTRYKDKQ